VRLTSVPRKVRQFKKELLDLGFDWRPGKGRHQVWSHPLVAFNIVIARKDGDDTPDYLERQLQQALAELQKSSEEDKA
jgi:predicted RNA binding protein YcfA (HicA-like mRNA interferase family)